MPVYACAREEDNSMRDGWLEGGGGRMERQRVEVGCKAGCANCDAWCMNADMSLIPNGVARGGMLSLKFATA